MTIKKQCICCTMAVALLLALSGCSGSDKLQLANEIRFSLDGISDVTISYDEELVTFFPADGDELVIREYMTKDKGSYHADVSQSSDSIHVSEGGKPLFHGDFSRYIEVYLPASYGESLTVTTTDGDIDLSDVDLRLASLRVDSTEGTVTVKRAAASKLHLSSTSGTLKLGSITAEDIRLETTSGKVSCDSLEGRVTYTSTSGSADIKGAKGSGSFKAENSGELNVVYTEVTGDLYLFNKNDSVCLTVPAGLDFDFEAVTKNGSVKTSFQESLVVSGDTVRAAVGSDPSAAIKVETKNGNIEVIR